MNITDLLSPDQIFLSVRAADKPRLLGELARRAAGPVALPANEIAAALSARELLGSTGVGGGIALPHARIVGLSRVWAFLARLDRPIAFDSVDGKPVDLVCLLLSPVGRDAEHLAALAALSRRLRTRTVTDAVRSAADTTEVIWAFNKEVA